jgi:hypothetical protein
MAENIVLDAGTGGQALTIQRAIDGPRNWRTPTLAMVHAAYIADDLDYEHLERLIEAALRGQPTEIPEPMLSLLFAPPPTSREERRAYIAKRLREFSS